MPRSAKFKVGESVTIDGWVMFITKNQYTYRGKQVVDAKGAETIKIRVPVSQVKRYEIPQEEELVSKQATEINTDQANPVNKYEKPIINKVGEHITVDVYDVLNAFKVTDPAIAHAIKKLLMPGQRGHKTVIGDLREAIVSIERAIDQQFNAERYQ